MTDIAGVGKRPPGFASAGLLLTAAYMGQARANRHWDRGFGCGLEPFPQAKMARLTGIVGLNARVRVLWQHGVGNRLPRRACKNGPGVVRGAKVAVCNDNKWVDAC